MRASAQQGLFVQGQAACSCVIEVVVRTRLQKTSASASALAAQPCRRGIKMLI